MQNILQKKNNLSVAMSKTLIKEFIKLSLLEKAKEPGEVTEEGLALSLVKNEQFVIYVLYDANGLHEHLLHCIEKYAAIGSRNTATYNLNLELQRPDISENYIHGMIKVVQADGTYPYLYGASEVELSAANQGYGPMMYDIAMSIEGKIYSDRTDVSAAAKNVWNHYKNNRSDVTALPIDDHENPKTKDQWDDGFVFKDKKSQLTDPESPMNYVYQLKNTKINVDEMLKRGHDFESMTKSLPCSGEYILRMLSHSFFKSKYYV